MGHATIAAALAAGLLAWAGAAPAARAQQQEQQQPGVAVTRTEALTGTVESVNLGSREVVLRDEGGRAVTVVAGPEARNLEQLRPGDRVSIEYRAALAAEMVRPGDAAPARRGARRRRARAGRRAPGRRPRPGGARAGADRRRGRGGGPGDLHRAGRRHAGR